VIVFNLFKYFFKRKSRGKLEENLSIVIKEDSSIVNDISNENNCQISSVPLLSFQINNSTSSSLLYLQSQFAVFTLSIAQCNIGELIRQPEYVDKNEWIAHNSLFHFSNKINSFFFNFKLFLFFII
jgi:hypothetical protein